MKSDQDIKKDVEDELRWDPDIDPTDIGVAVKNGVVTLTGFVRSYQQKYQAERDVKRVEGVHGVANDLEVRLPVDPPEARPGARARGGRGNQEELPYSHSLIKVLASGGWVTLEGDVEWNYQKERAEAAVRRVRGIKGITNFVMIKPKVDPRDVKRKIEEALRRSAEVDAQDQRGSKRQRGDP